MKKISLSQGKVAIVDDEDFEFLSQWKWHVVGGGYAARSVRHAGKRFLIYMHRALLEADEVDHINRNKLDNRRANLRACDRSGNMLNREKFSGSSRFKGVHFDQTKQLWRASFRGVSLGRFKHEEVAAIAYNVAAAAAVGKYALLNQVEMG